MTPKEKAKRLVDQYREFVRFDKPDDTPDAKECALISVYEIIEAIGGEKISNHPTGIYWQQVMQEIKKL